MYMRATSSRGSCIAGADNEAYTNTRAAATKLTLDEEGGIGERVVVRNALEGER